MKIKNLSRSTAVILMFFTSIASSAPLYIDVGSVGSMGDSKIVPSGMFGGDSDTITSAFDSMTFGISNAEDLTTIGSGKVDTLRFEGSSVFGSEGLGGTEAIGFGFGGINLYTLWDNSTSILGHISFWFEDDADANGSADFKVASGTITHLSETGLAADITSLFDGFWLNGNMSNLEASVLNPFQIAMGVQSGGSSVDVKAVPEPSILALMTLGLLGLGLVGRRTHKKSGQLA